MPIAGLESYVKDHRLVAPFDPATSAKAGAVAVGLAADGLSVTTLQATLESLAPLRPVVVFDGPGRLKPERLDGLQRRELQDALIAQGVRFIVAPALASAQLAYLARHRFISHIVLDDSAWMFGDAPLLLPLEESPLKWGAVSKMAVVNSLRLGSDAQFVEAAIAAGSPAVAEPFPLLERKLQPIAAATKFAQIHGGGSMLRALTSSLDGASYMPRFQESLAFVTWQPVLADDGSVQLLSSAQVPRDIHEAIGVRLSDVIYWYVSRGLVGPEMVRAFARGWFADDVHFKEAGTAYRDIQSKLVPVRRETVALLARPQHRYFNYHEIVSRTEGLPTFTKPQPQPKPVAFDSAAEAADNGKKLVGAAIAHVRSIAGISDESDPAKWAALVAGAAADDPKICRVAALALRELAEAVVFSLLSEGKVDPQAIDTCAVVASLPLFIAL